jgi:putative inorganic carbon (HCO3(-)) transporter
VFTTRVADVFSLPKLIALWGLLAIVSMLIIASTLSDGSRVRVTPIGMVDAPVAAFVALTIVALAVSTDRRQSLFGERLQHQGVLTTLLYVGFFYAARALVRDAKRMRRLAAAVSIGAVGVSGYAIIQRLGLDPIWNGQLPSGRVFSTIGQANALAGYLVLAIPITTALALASSARVLRLVALTAVAMMIAALIFTSSRGGFVAIALAAVVFAYGARERTMPQSTAGRALIGAAIAGVVLLLALATPVRATVAELWQSDARVRTAGGMDSIGEHRELWKVAIEIVERKPFFGTGPETFADQFGQYAPAVLPAATVRDFEQFRVESPHHQLLAIAVGAGIPAAIAYIAVLVGLARTLWRRAERTRDPAARALLAGVLAAGAGHLVTDSFMTAEVTGSWLFWTLAGAGIGLVEITTARRDAVATARVEP